MKRNSKEFMELMDNFESAVQAMPIYVGAALTRSKPDENGKFYTSNAYYDHGKVNELFIAYMYGYQHAKCLARIDSLPLDE